MGVPLAAPNCPHERVYVLPLLTILTNKVRRAEAGSNSIRGAQGRAPGLLRGNSAAGGAASSHEGLYSSPWRQLLNSRAPYPLPSLQTHNPQGTGIVTSVPSDSPDDYTALMVRGSRAALTALGPLRAPAARDCSPARGL